jgi:5'-deoxynucleotidase YfbR-like HD superfamily hydrolase
MAFEREYRELVFINRWQILRRIHEESVAEHSFYVAIYCKQIAELIDWPQYPDKSDKARATVHQMRAILYMAALHHDLPEVAVGDIMGPIKRRVVNRSKLQNLEFQYLTSTFGMLAASAWDLSHVERIKHIVKAADLMDEAMYLQTERGLGNVNVGLIHDPLSALGNTMSRLRTAWDALPAEPAVLTDTWQNHVWPAILRAGPDHLSRLMVDTSMEQMNVEPEAESNCEVILATAGEALPGADLGAGEGSR